MAAITVLVPHSRRPLEALELHNAVKAASDLDVELVFAVERDDPTHDYYYWHLTQADGHAVTVERGPEGLVAALKALQKAPEPVVEEKPSTPRKAAPRKATGKDA